MTKEEAIKNLELILYQFQSSVDEAKSEFAEEWQKESLQDNKEAVESLEMAIKVLEQGHCKDSISRQAVLTAMRKNHRSGGRDIDGDYVEGDYMEDLYDDIVSIPSVIPQSKIGKWIKHDTGHSIYYDCSRCNCIAPCTETADKWLWKLSNYCPDCGAKMIESEVEL